MKPAEIAVLSDDNNLTTFLSLLLLRSSQPLAKEILFLRTPSVWHLSVSKDLTGITCLVSASI